MSRASYAAYKPSGIDVIGAIPAHWEARSLCQLGRLLKGVGGSKDDVVAEGVPCVRYGDLYTTHAEVIEEARTFLTEDRAAAYTPIRYGDVLFAASGEKIEEIGKSAVNLIPGEARCGGDLVILRPSVPTVPRFIGYAADAAPSVAQKASMGRGTTVKHIYPDELRHLKVAIPPIPEQEAIADFLDRKTAAIDALITKKERLIELLQEKRQVLITQAVTKGLDPRVPMKDSGIEWLGEIPSHWKVDRLRHISPRIGVGVVVSPSQYVSDFGVPFLYGADIGQGFLRAQDARRISVENSRRLAVSQLRTGDLVTIRVGATRGWTAVIPPEFEGANCASIMITRGHSSFCSDWLCFSMNSRLGMAQIEAVEYGAAQPQFNVSHATEFWFPVPPLTEQRAIAAHLFSLRHRALTQQALLQQSIEKLREYRQALISVAVTGKIDVTKERAA